MSGFNSPRGTGQPKQISSRLLNMKFMQRAAASTPQSKDGSPSIASYEPAPKRRRTGDFQDTANKLNASSKSASVTTPQTPSNHAASSGPLSGGINGYTVRRGTNNFEVPGEETEWVLDVKLPVMADAEEVDQEEGEEGYEEDEQDSIWSSTAPSGRQTYGSFKKKGRKATNANGATATTPKVADNPTNKRNRSDDEDLSSLPSDLASDDSSNEDGINRIPQPRQKKGKFDFKSDMDLKRMDASDLRRGGGDQGFGRQRPGLSGGGGFGSPGQGPTNQGQGKRKKKVRKTM